MDPPPSPKSNSRRRVQQAQISAAGGPLQLPTLPRFHPTTYHSVSNQTSMQTTPYSNDGSPMPVPMSPRTQQRALETHRYMVMYASAVTKQEIASIAKPPSPKLVPNAGAPNAITPLELDGSCYITTGVANQQSKKTVDSFIREEAARRRDMSPRRTAAST